MTKPGIEPRSLGPLANTQATRPMNRCKAIQKSGKLKRVLEHVAEKYRPCEIGQCVIYTVKHVLVKNVYTWAIYLKECRNRIQEEHRPDRPSVASTPEMMNSVNALILVKTHHHHHHVMLLAWIFLTLILSRQSTIASVRF